MFQRYLYVILILVSVFACSQRTYRMDEPIVSPSKLPRKALPSIVEETSPPAWDFDAVFFRFDSDALQAPGKRELDKTVQWLKEHAPVQLQIEGYCDERGSDAYNYALGNRRAMAVKQYLVSQGIKADRLVTVSYGRVEGQGESIRQQNRRTSFVVIYAE